MGAIVGRSGKMEVRMRSPLDALMESSLRELIPPRVLRRIPRRQTLDARIYVALNGLPHRPSLDENVTLLSDLGKGAGWVAGSAMLALRGGSRGRRAGTAATVAMLCATALVQGPAKAVFRRRRPFAHRVATVVGVRPTDSSFPSGHTAGSFAAATALTAFYPRQGPLLMLAAGGVGLSRVYLGHHFPSDVLVGAAMGGAIGAIVARLAGAGVGDAGDRGSGVEVASRVGVDEVDSTPA